MSQPTSNLDYAERPPLRCRRSFRRRLTLAAWVCILGGLFLVGPSLWLQARLWYWEGQCASYQAPPSGWACEERPSWAGHTPPFLSAAPTPEPLAQLERLAGMATPIPRGPVLYLHDRTTVGGVRRLVVIRRVPPAQRQSWDAPLGLDIALWRPRPHLFSEVAMTSCLEVDPFPRAFEADQDTVSLRLFPGQTHPTDTARFHIPFETVDGPGTLEGVLLDPATPGGEPRVDWRLR